MVLTESRVHSFYMYNIRNPSTPRMWSSQSMTFPSLPGQSSVCGPQRGVETWSHLRGIPHQVPGGGGAAPGGMLNTKQFSVTLSGIQAAATTKFKAWKINPIITPTSSLTVLFITRLGQNGGESLLLFTHRTGPKAKLSVHWRWDFSSRRWGRGDFRWSTGQKEGRKQKGLSSKLHLVRI